MDLMSLGQRLDWGELKAFVSGVDNPNTLGLLASQARNAEPQLPTLFAAVALSQKPAEVAAYVNDFSQTGLKDLGASLHFGEGGVNADVSFRYPVSSWRLGCGVRRRQQQLQAREFTRRAR